MGWDSCPDHYALSASMCFCYHLVCSQLCHIWWLLASALSSVICLWFLPGWKLKILTLSLLFLFFPLILTLLPLPIMAQAAYTPNRPVFFHQCTLTSSNRWTYIRSTIWSSLECSKLSYPLPQTDVQDVRRSKHYLQTTSSCPSVPCHCLPTLPAPRPGVVEMILFFQHRLLRNRSSAKGVPSGKLAWIGMTARSPAVCIFVKMVVCCVSGQMGTCCWHHERQSVLNVTE